MFQLTVVHPNPGPASLPVYSSDNILESKAAHRLVSQHTVDLSSPHLTQHEYYGGGIGVSGAQQSHLVVGLIVISVCVLISVLVVAVVKMKEAHRRHLREEQEVEMVMLQCCTNTEIQIKQIFIVLLFAGLG